MYICPVCQLPLTAFNQAAATTLRCEQGHSFDRHKKGYINLLLVQNKRSKQPGDDSAMVAGRRAFLNAGFYQPLAQTIADWVRAKQVSTVLDAGCGEGYYLQHLQQQQSSLKAFGFDISKPAIQSASRYKSCEWAVASSARMPYADAVFDLVLSVFSRVESAEFLRVLKPKAWVLFVGPGPRHLLALRKLIYNDIRHYNADKHQDYFARGFSLVKQAQLQLPLVLNSHEQIMNLLSMTPHGQRVSTEAQARLAATQSLEEMADFRLYLYQKQPD